MGVRRWRYIFVSSCEQKSASADARRRTRDNAREKQRERATAGALGLGAAERGCAMVRFAKTFPDRGLQSSPQGEEAMIDPFQRDGRSKFPCWCLHPAGVTGLRMKRALAILYASALVVAPLPTQALSDASLKNCSRSAVDTFAKTRLAQFKKGASFPGTTLAIFVPTRWSRPIAVVHGTTRPSASQPMRADVPMLAGSVGKTFFAAAALRLADERKLDLDRPIATYLPLANIPGAQQVTSRMLLSHTSGYGEYDGEFMETLIREPSRARALPDWIGPLQRNPPAAPGSYRYSDINFVLLGLVIDKASGEGAYRYIMRTMVRPYGLKSTFPADRIGLPGLAPGHAGAENFFGRDAMLDGGRLYYNPQFEFGGGGFVSSASDLARWIVLFSSATVVSPASWAQASRPVHVDAAKGRSYGLGIHIDRTPAGTAYGHSGYIPGYLSWVRWYPDVGISVAMQANASDELRVPWDGYELLDQLTVSVAAACK